MKYRIIEVVLPLQGLKYIVQLEDSSGQKKLLADYDFQSFSLYGSKDAAERAVQEYVENHPLLCRDRKIVKEGEF